MSSVSSVNERVYTVLFPFCGLGGGALGFQAASVTMQRLGISARFRVLGGIEWDEGTARDFERLTGAPCLGIDVTLLTPEFLREWFGPTAPDVVFFSPPCKGASGLLDPAVAATAKYQAMNELILVWLRVMFEAWPEGPRLVLMENVPRIRQRAGKALAEARRILRAHGYVLHDEAHDLGAIGGLAQHRDRLLLVGRHAKRVPGLLYQPVPKRVRAVGEVLGALPLPGDPSAGPLHQLPAIDTITALRLALIPAGGDWRDLPAQVHLPPEIAAAVATRKARPSARTPFNDVYRVVRWTEAGPCVTTGGTPSAGGIVVADPRVSGKSLFTNNHAVTAWSDPARTIAGQIQPGSGAQSVADPRLNLGPHAHTNLCAVTAWDAPGRTVTGASRPAGGAPSVADPRVGRTGEARSDDHGVIGWDEPSGVITCGARPSHGRFSVADPRPIEVCHPRTYGVIPWDGSSGTVTGNASPGGGPFSVADPRVTCKTRENSGIYGVIPWSQPSGTIAAHACHDNGRFSVADPRWPASVPFPVIIAEDGTWHRPLTLLERAALQSLPTTLDGGPLTLTGRSRAAWSVRIGDCVPPAAAREVATQMLLTLVQADAGAFTLSSGGAVWVRDRRGEAVLQ